MSKSGFLGPEFETFRVNILRWNLAHVFLRSKSRPNIFLLSSVAYSDSFKFKKFSTGIVNEVSWLRKRQYKKLESPGGLRNLRPKFPCIMQNKRKNKRNCCDHIKFFQFQKNK
jgi:hypothetical protein